MLGPEQGNDPSLFLELPFNFRNLRLERSPMTFRAKPKDHRPQGLQGRAVEDGADAGTRRERPEQSSLWFPVAR